MNTDEEKPDTPSLERRVNQPGRHVGDRYVRIMRPTGSGIPGHGGRYVATEQTMERTGRVGRGWDAPLRFLVIDVPYHYQDTADLARG